MDNVYELILRTPDGREQRSLAWIPNEQVRKDICEKAQRNGLQIELSNI